MSGGSVIDGGKLDDDVNVTLWRFDVTIIA